MGALKENRLISLAVVAAKERMTADIEIAEVYLYR